MKIQKTTIMKAFITLSLVVISNIAIAQKTSDIPLAVRQAFAKQYTDPKDIKWEKEKDNYEVSFVYHRDHMSAVYSADGHKVETETKIAIDNLPDAARKYATAKGKIKEAARIMKADGSIMYEAEVDGIDLLFDKAGTFVSQSKD